MRQSLEYREQRDGGFFDSCKKSVIGALLVSDKKTHGARGRLIRTQKNPIGARLVRGCLPSLGLRCCNHYSNPRGGTFVEQQLVLLASRVIDSRLQLCSELVFRYGPLA
jgi:hypothetical protein